MAPQQQESFEELYQRLEETVARLEAGNLPLEESIALYEDGMALARRCQELLDSAEFKISRLKEDFAGAAYRSDDDFFDEAENEMAPEERPPQ